MLENKKIVIIVGKAGIGLAAGGEYAAAGAHENIADEAGELCLQHFGGFY